jgi:endonuclease YncB( thermonuclease family)
VALVVTLTACAPLSPPIKEPAARASPSSSDVIDAPATEQAVAFLSVIDGDTIETSAGTVRIIGVDTPERGQCGHDQSTQTVNTALAPGDNVTIELPAGQNNQDRHGRLIRYATTATGIDIGLLQLQAGNAVARYDSRDGYPAHPRETNYHAAQSATLDRHGSVITTACQALAVAPPPATDQWWRQYPSCAKLKTNSIGHPTGPFHRHDPDQNAAYVWFANGTGNNGDGDSDGIACE